MKTAFGSHGLGMPLSGSPHHYKYLSAHVIQKFQLENINPNRIFVCAAGVENHQEFVELVESKLSFIPSVQDNASHRETSEYLGGEFRNHTDSNELSLALAFRSAPWGSKDIFALQVLSAVLGNSSSFSSGGPGKGMHARTSKNLLNKHSFIDSARAVNFNFSDAGLFGLCVTGSASNVYYRLMLSSSNYLGF